MFVDDGTVHNKDFRRVYWRLHGLSFLCNDCPCFKCYCLSGYLLVVLQRTYTAKVNANCFTEIRLLQPMLLP